MSFRLTRLPISAPPHVALKIIKSGMDTREVIALDATLKKMGVAQLIVVGATTSVCVESTIRDANSRDYWCVLLADCTAEPMGDGRTNYHASLQVIQARFGAISDSETFVKAVASRVASAR